MAQFQTSIGQWVSVGPDIVDELQQVHVEIREASLPGRPSHARTRARWFDAVVTGQTRREVIGRGAPQWRGFPLERAEGDPWTPEGAEEALRQPDGTDGGPLTGSTFGWAIFRLSTGLAWTVAGIKGTAAKRRHHHTTPDRFFNDDECHQLDRGQCRHGLRLCAYFLLILFSLLAALCSCRLGCHIRRVSDGRVATPHRRLLRRIPLVDIYPTAVGPRTPLD